MPRNIVVLRLRGLASLVMPAALRHARHDELGVLLLCHSGEFLDKCHGRPQFVVSVIAPGRHAGHLDAVLDDPEKLAGAVECRGFAEIRRLWLDVLDSYEASR